MVAGLEQPTAGEIRIGGVLVNNVQPRNRDIAMVFQNYALYPHMNVEKNLAFGLKQRDVPRDEIASRVGRIADVLGLDELMNRKPGQLSGGQRQRVAMGRALVREPKALLMDEPLSNLDAKLRVQMRAELKKLHARLGTTTIYVTHDQVEAMTLGDRIVVMSQGRVHQIGSPQDVYDHPANVFVAGFIGSPPMNLLRGTSSAGHITAGDMHLDRPGTPDGDLVVGIRPENMHTAPTGTANVTMTLEIEVVEPLGDEVMVHGTVAGRSAQVEAAEDLLESGTDTRAEVVARLAPHERVAPGDSIDLVVDPDKAYLFLGATGEAIE
jgi:ABC-type sugar transport system ATPase subunit